MKVSIDTLALAKVTRRDLRAKVATLTGAAQLDRTVSFNYDGKFREVEVHAIGTSTKDNGLVLRGVQVSGDASRPLPAWTLFRVEGIEGLGLTFAASEAPREGFTEGDRQMNSVIVQLEV